jgi:hypothetical protein
VTEHVRPEIAVHIHVTAAEGNSAQEHAWTRLWVVLLAPEHKSPAPVADTETGVEAELKDCADETIDKLSA